MAEKDLVRELAEFGREAHREVKGLSARIDWHIYGVESDYLVPIGDASRDIATSRKERVDWETFVLLDGAGARQGHMTGNPERRTGGGWSGRMEEKKDMQFIHQLLPDNLSALKGKCDLRYPALSERVALMVSEPHCSSAILFFQEFLRSIYRGVSGADAALLLGHLKTLPSNEEPAVILDRWNEIEKRVKAEKRSSIYEVKDGHFHVYEKIGKDRRLVNGWIFGIEEKRPEETAASEGPQASQYEQQVEGAAFHTRMKMLQLEVEHLVGEKSGDVVALVADQKSGALAKLIASIDALAAVDDVRGMEPQRKMALKALADQTEMLAAIASRHAKLIEPFAIDTDALAQAAVKAQNLKRKLRG